MKSGSSKRLPIKCFNKMRPIKWLPTKIKRVHFPSELRHARFQEPQETYIVIQYNVVRLTENSMPKIGYVVSALSYH